MTDKQQVVDFPNPRLTEDELLRRLEAEAKRLANQPEVERNFRMGRSAEALGVSTADLRKAVNAILKEQSQRTAAEQLVDKKREKQRVDEDRKQEREQRQAEQEKQRKQKQIEQEAQRKAKEKRKAFGNLAMMPVAHHEKELERLAELFGEDVAALHHEFEDFLGVEGGALGETTEPWPEPVQTAALLSEVSNKISRYVVLQPHQLTAASLWTVHCWLYDYDVPTHSPILALTSAEPDSGKTTLIATIGCVSPRYSLNIEMTGPSLYRYVDRVKPTLMIDEADDLFVRRSDLKHIINAGWTRGAKIPRQVCIGGVWQTTSFDPFTPKAIALLGRNLPGATRTRCIELRMLPKRTDEKVESFNHVDDAEFAVLRQKCARWAADNAARLKDASPTMPSGLNNRVGKNWHTILAIAELAGGTWPQRAREAAERLSRSGRRPSDGVQLLAVFKEIFASGKKVITSEDMVSHLRRDQTSIWADFNRGGAVTQRQVAHLLDPFDIHPIVIHPNSNSSFRGYKLEQFADAFARYLPEDLNISTSPKSNRTTVKKKKPSKRAKSRR